LKNLIILKKKKRTISLKVNKSNKNSAIFSSNMKKAILVLILLLLSTIAIAQHDIKQGHLTLLAVKDTLEGFKGSTADLFLEIRPGSGRVFLDTFPLTKVDTQISTRFAKEIACNFLKKDCNDLDFIYTIKAESSIIAGPSAGAAATVLTVALLDDLKIDESIAITGTINSGGLIGHVGGIKQKIDAGVKKGLKKVIIPKGEKIILEKEKKEEVDWNITNDTLTVILENKTIPKEISSEEYSKKKNIEIVEVSTLNQALYEFTGKKYIETEKELEVNPQYIEIMKSLALDLCNRTEKLKKDLGKTKLKENASIKLKEGAINLSSKGDLAFNQEIYYSSASYCFGANVKYSQLYMITRNYTIKNIMDVKEVVKNGIEKIRKDIDDKEIKTITDLESYAAVKERLLDAENVLNKIEDNITDKESAIYNLAYASERVYSALSWYEFFKNIGKEFDLNKEKIKESCQNKISEAEERYQYVKLLFPQFLKDTKKEINYAYTFLKEKEYELCLFKASIAKSQADIVLNLIGLDENQTKEQLDIKFEVVENSIIKATEDNIFPIMAYSYYEYAKALKESDLYSSLLYAEYALELVNFNMYFDIVEDKTEQKVILLGILINTLFRNRKIKKKPKKRRI